MERKSKIFLVIIALIVVFVIGFKYKQFFLDKDFTITSPIVCDPLVESCFRVVCDGECVEVPPYVFSDGTPYKKVAIIAANAPECFEEQNCTDFVCPADDNTCSITYCSDETLEEGEECVQGSIDKNSESEDILLPEATTSADTLESTL